MLRWRRCERARGTTRCVSLLLLGEQNPAPLDRRTLPSRLKRAAYGVRSPSFFFRPASHGHDFVEDMSPDHGDTLSAMTNEPKEKGPQLAQHATSPSGPLCATLQLRSLCKGGRYVSYLALFCFLLESTHRRTTDSTRVGLGWGLIAFRINA